MSIQMNQSLSVDCAVFGFNGKSLKVLLIERRYYKPDTRLDKLKLPGAMILENETLPEAAYRVLEEATGLKNVYLKQMDIFSDPKRVAGEELEWINRYHGIQTDRVVTVGYYALVKLDSRTIAYTDGQRGPMGRCGLDSAAGHGPQGDPFGGPHGAVPRDAAIAGGLRAAAAQIHDPGVAEPLQRRAGHRDRQPQLPQKNTGLGFPDPHRRKGARRGPQTRAILHVQ